jgi:hypothetical protein
MLWAKRTTPKPLPRMNTDEIFQTSARLQTKITDRQRQDALNKEAHQQDQANKAQDKAVAINARLWSGLQYLSTQEFPATKRNGYDIQHYFQLSLTPLAAMQQLHTVLHLYMSRGGVVHMRGGTLPYRADYELTLTGDDSSGAIIASFHARATNQSEHVDAFSSADELSDSRLSDVFQSFIKQSVQCEEQRTVTGHK